MPGKLVSAGYREDLALAVGSCSSSFQGLQGPEGEDGIPGTPGRVGPPGKTVRGSLNPPGHTCHWQTRAH